MNRRFHKKKSEIELFPFLSVLACTIGSLILLIIVISLQNFSKKPEVTILAIDQADGQNHSKKPHYIECKKDGVIIHPSQEFISADNFEGENSPLSNFIAKIKAARNSEYIIFAIRPDGVNTFQQIRNKVEQENIDIGYEPIEEKWILKIK